jgi:hypothetical protein
VAMVPYSLGDIRSGPPGQRVVGGGQ